MKELVIKDFCYISDGNYSSKYPRSDEFKESGIPFIRANNLVNGTVVSDDMYFISPEKHLELRKGHLQTDDVLITTRGNIGQTAVVPSEFHDANINAQIVLLRVDKEKIIPKYLEYALHTDTVVQQIESSITGTALKQLPVGRLEKIKVKIHPKNEQEHIVSVLQKIDTLISAQKQQLETIETIVKSRFIEMFGDPETNPKGYKTVLLSDIAEYYNGLTYSPDNVAENGTIVLRSSNIQNSQLDFEDTVRVDCPVKEKMFVKENDILMCSRNGSARLVGKVALIKNLSEPMSFGAFMMIIRSKYYSYLMTYFQMDAFRRQIKTGATTTINQITGNMLNKISLPLPEISDVNQFAEFVEQTDKLKFEIKEALEKLEILKKSLMQEYFG